MRRAQIRKCEDCGHSVSRRAKACPQCGAPFGGRTSPAAWGCLLVILIGALTQAFLPALLPSGSSSSSTPRTAAERSAEKKSIAANAPSSRLQQDTPEELWSKPQYRYSQQNADALCREEWTTRGQLNERMYRHCLQRQKEGYGELEQLVRQHFDFQWISVVLQRAWETWTKRGRTNYTMVHHQMAGEVEGYLNIQFERQQPDFDAPKMSMCIAKWKDHDSPWSMAFYSYQR